MELDEPANSWQDYDQCTLSCINPTLTAQTLSAKKTVRSPMERRSQTGVFQWTLVVLILAVALTATVLALDNVRKRTTR